MIVDAMRARGLVVGVGSSPRGGNIPRLSRDRSRSATTPAPVVSNITNAVGSGTGVESFGTARSEVRGRSLEKSVSKTPLKVLLA